MLLGEKSSESIFYIRCEMYTVCAWPPYIKISKLYILSIDSMASIVYTVLVT